MNRAYRFPFHIECLWRELVARVFEEVDWAEELQGIADGGGRHVRKPYYALAG